MQWKKKFKGIDYSELFSLGQGTVSPRPQGTLFHAVSGCCKCFQQCRIAGTARLETLGSYQTLLEAFATPWDSVEQCSMGTLSLVPRSKVASSGLTFRHPRRNLGLHPSQLHPNMWAATTGHLWPLKVALDGGTRPGDTLQILPIAVAQPPNPRSITSHSVLRGHPSLTHCVGFFRGIQWGIHSQKIIIGTSILFF